MKRSLKATAEQDAPIVSEADGPEAIDGAVRSVPVTPPSRVPAPPPDPFFAAGRSLLDRAGLLRSRLATEKSILFQDLVGEGVLVGSLDLPALFEATFGDRTGAAFWKLRLGGMIGPGQFVILLATFLTVEGGKRSTHEFALRATLTRDLADAGVVPIPTEVEHAPVTTRIDPETGRQHLITSVPSTSLEGRWFDPSPVVKWMAEREIYHRFLPSSLRVYCGIEGCPMPSTQGEFDLRRNKAPRQRGPRPDTSRRIEQEMRDAIHRGVDLGSMKTAEMSATFKAAASTCTVARDRVLSELGSQKKSE